MGFHSLRVLARWTVAYADNSIVWAIVLACHAATTNFTGLMVARFFLGCTEASVSPGFSLLTSLWYRTAEQPLRHGIWFCGNSLSLIIGGAIAVGIWQIESSLATWKVCPQYPHPPHLTLVTDPCNHHQWLYIIFGLVTFTWGVVMLFRLPDSPTNATFLTPEERVIAVARLKSNRAGYKTNRIDKRQMVEACTDPKTWLLGVLILGCNIPNGGYTTVCRLFCRRKTCIFLQLLTWFGWVVLRSHPQGLRLQHPEHPPPRDPGGIHLVPRGVSLVSHRPRSQKPSSNP